ncbi:MAG: hypothetical protein GF375_07695 [Candidatus Omnitrophica bacterium]|nr:hypothetical protein [Candidatus Omnitrophota bacterium]MBD3269846.1 hypothetical protein [Candidatus Omnitrophota bacterium]
MADVAKVVFPIAIDKDFDYLLPANRGAEPGMRVEVDFRGRRCLGIILDCRKKTSCKNIKPVSRLLDIRPVLSQENIRTAKELTKIYPYPLAEFLFMILPPYMRRLHSGGRKKGDDSLGAEKASLNISQKTLTGETKNILDKPLFVQGFGLSFRYGFWREYVKKIEESGSVLICLPRVWNLGAVKTLFERDFKKPVFILHSYQSQRDNFNLWKSSRSNCIILGTRSTIFYYPYDLRLIIVDEENSPYYLQEEKPFYHLREVAGIVASIKNAGLIFSGYYPSLEIYKEISKNKISMVSEDYKKNNFKIVDISRSASRKLISPVLSEILRKNLEDNRQSVILWNKQGFGRFVSCSSCGGVYSCRRCSAPLRYHRRENLAVCPYCQKSESLPGVCPECGNGYFKFTGYGIERIESTLTKIFPQVGVSTLKEGKTDSRIIVSTSKILDYLYRNTKFDDGLVLDADFLLSAQDYLSVFNTYVYLKKVSFLFSGHCYIFTAKRSYYLYQYLEKPWPEFYESELRLRKKMRLPPFIRLIKLVFRARNEKNLLHQVENFLSLLEKEFEEIYGPHKEYPFKLRDKYRYSLVVKINGESDYGSRIRKIADSFSLGGTRLAIKVN